MNGWMDNMNGCDEWLMGWKDEGKNGWIVGYNGDDEMDG